MRVWIVALACGLLSCAAPVPVPRAAVAPASSASQAVQAFDRAVRDVVARGVTPDRWPTPAQLRQIDATIVILTTGAAELAPLSQQHAPLLGVERSNAQSVLRAVADLGALVGPWAPKDVRVKQTAVTEAFAALVAGFPTGLIEDAR